jgi:uncharacterized protein
MILKINNKIITKDLKIAESFIDNALGLLLKSNPRFMLFKTGFGIHTFFMREEIDVVVLDSKNKVVKIKKSLKPNSVFFWNPKYTQVIELPKGKIAQFSINISDSLAVSE